MLTSRMVKLEGSEETASHETVLLPLVDQPVLLFGDVTEMASAEAAKASRVATERISSVFAKYEERREV